MVRFHMTKKTTLSDEEMTQGEGHSAEPQGVTCRCAVDGSSIQGRSTAIQSRDAEFLIANLELEFELSHRKQSALKISNRKYLTNFSATFLSFSASIPTQSSNPNSNIGTIRIFTNSRAITTYAFSNRNKIAPFDICPRPRFSPRKGTSRDMIPALTLLQ
jgi:hypothetical protein